MKRVAFASVCLALLFYAADWHDAAVEKLAAETAARRTREMDQNATAWYVARWGFQFYAERAGMRPVLPDRSELRPGDWLVLPDGISEIKPVAEHIRRYRIEPITRLTFEDPLPLKTMMGYYGGGIPLHHHEGPHRTVRIYKVMGEKK